jgi:hypothetical protein
VKQVYPMLPERSISDQNDTNPKMKYIQTKYKHKFESHFPKIKFISLTDAIGNAAPAKIKSRHFCNTERFSNEYVFEPKKKLIIHNI